MKRFFILFLFLTQFASAQNFISFLDVAADINNAEKEVTPLANSTIVPFTILEGMMVVEATVNQQKGNYIIDTGAPTLVLNEQPSASSQLGRGISNGLLTEEVIIQEFNWSGIHKKDVDAFMVDISHLEKISGRDLAGIIGYDILKEVELLVDYQTQTVQLSPLKTKTSNIKKPVAVIPFTMQAHLPVIKVRIGKKKLRLALDTASESNILDQKIFSKINAALISNHQVGEIQGVDQQVKKVQVATVQQTSVKGLSLLSMNYLFTDLSHLKTESGLYIDGLLGYPFFKQGKMSINYHEQKIYIWEIN